MTNLQHDYIHRVESKMDELEVVEDGTKVRVLGGSDNDDSDGERPAVVPTTEELLEYIHDPKSYKEIETMQEDCIQRAEEKVAIANQTLSLVDNICKRLESDCSSLEKVLEVSDAIYFFKKFDAYI